MKRFLTDKPTLDKNLDDLEKELQKIRELFPNLSKADVDRSFLKKISEGQIVLPEGAERWTLIPLWNKVAPTYLGSVEKVMEAIGMKHEHSYWNSFGPENFRQTEKSLWGWKEIGLAQPGFDILIVPVQLGALHFKKTVEQARLSMREDEFGLGVFAAGIYLLTHPKRLRNRKDLGIDCAGDECHYMPDMTMGTGAAVENFLASPLFVLCLKDWFRYASFQLSHGQIQVSLGFCDRNYFCTGSASFFQVH
jgi:hypothetical protein